MYAPCISKNGYVRTDTARRGCYVRVRTDSAYTDCPSKCVQHLFGTQYVYVLRKQGERDGCHDARAYAGRRQSVGDGGGTLGVERGAAGLRDAVCGDACGDSGAGSGIRQRGGHRYDSPLCSSGVLYNPFVFQRQTAKTVLLYGS